MSFPVVAGMRALELGDPGAQRRRLNELVLDGRKVATFGHHEEYRRAGEAFEHVGERLALVDDSGDWVGTVEVVTSLPVAWSQVTWAMVEAEGEGDRDIADWREGHEQYWSAQGMPVADDTILQWLRFRLVDPRPAVQRVTAGDLGLPEGYRHAYAGKVRDLFASPDGNLLFVASDRISAYDWVLPSTIPDKGAILTALSLWWFDRVGDIVGNHVVSTEVPAGVAGRAMSCLPLQMLPVECVARGYLTGSGLSDYRATGAVCGVTLPTGLVDGSRLPAPIFTPATKAALGDHDENVDFGTVVATVGADDAEQLRDLTLAVYSRAEAIARERGIIVADTKLEFGRRTGLAAGVGSLLLADEVLTPDSSRFWPADRWQPGSPGGQPSFDKQYVRDWLASPQSQWDRSSGEPPPALPQQVVERTRQLYVDAFERLTGQRWGTSGS